MWPMREECDRASTLRLGLHPVNRKGDAQQGPHQAKDAADRAIEPPINEVADQEAEEGQADDGVGNHQTEPGAPGNLGVRHRHAGLLLGLIGFVALAGLPGRSLQFLDPRFHLGVGRL